MGNNTAHVEKSEESSAAVAGLVLTCSPLLQVFPFLSPFSHLFVTKSLSDIKYPHVWIGLVSTLMSGLLSTCVNQHVLQVEYLKSRQLGGAAVWTLDMDDFSGQFCEQGKYPLTSHLKHELSGGKAPIL